MKTFKIRASAANSIMANVPCKKMFNVADFPMLDSDTLSTVFGKRKTATRATLETHINIPEIAAALKTKALPTGAETFAKNWLIRQLTGKREIQIMAKQILKGQLMEEHAIDYLSGIECDMYQKNTAFFQNEWITGSPDIIAPSEIIDIKLPWDVSSMPYFEDDLPGIYWWQMQCYMCLCDKPSARVVYLLVDCPSALIESAIKRAEWNGMRTDDIAKNLTFEDVPDHLRKVEYKVERDANAIRLLCERVEIIRDYITELKNRL